MQKVKILQKIEFHDKGDICLVTDRYATKLAENKLAELVKEKEEKTPEVKEEKAPRVTKENKAAKRRKTK